MTRLLDSNRTLRRAQQLAAACVLLWAWGQAHAALGQTQIAATAIDGPVTVYYPSNDEERTVARGRLHLSLAVERR